MSHRILILLAGMLPALLSAGGYTHLPRDLGPFKLGMSASEFQQITSVAADACPICIPDEFYATLTREQANQHIDSVRIGDGVDFFFYKNKLYHISISPAASDLFEAQQEFTAMFGNDGKQESRQNGTAQMRWEDGPTVLTLNYRPEENIAFAVNYYDWNVKEDRDFQEKLIFESGTAFAAQ